jgi:thymidylate kinase
MGVERMHPPRYWLMRAEEFRTKADACEYAETRDTLRKIAENYLDLARRAKRVRSLRDIDQQSRLESDQASQG